MAEFFGPVWFIDQMQASIRDSLLDGCKIKVNNEWILLESVHDNEKISRAIVDFLCPNQVGKISLKRLDVMVTGKGSVIVDGKPVEFEIKKITGEQ